MTNLKPLEKVFVTCEAFRIFRIDEGEQALPQNGGNTDHAVVLGAPSVRNYQCACAEGFYGDYCKYTWEMRHCEEVVCNSRAVVSPEKWRQWNGQCRCECIMDLTGKNPMYYGERVREYGVSQKLCDHLLMCLSQIVPITFETHCREKSRIERKHHSANTCIRALYGRAPTRAIA